MSEELKPCSFCGAQLTMSQSMTGTMQYPGARWINCEYCFARGPMTDLDKRPEKAWDTRPIEDALRAELEAAKAEVKRLRALISEAVDCWFNHDKRGDHAEMQAMYALRDDLHQQSSDSQAQRPALWNGQAVCEVATAARAARTGE